MYAWNVVPRFSTLGWFSSTDLFRVGPRYNQTFVHTHKRNVVCESKPKIVILRVTQHRIEISVSLEEDAQEREQSDRPDRHNIECEKTSNGTFRLRQYLVMNDRGGCREDAGIGIWQQRVRRNAEAMLT